MELKNKNVLVCGMAKSGASAAMLAKKMGANVTVQDINTIEKLEYASKLEDAGINLYLGKNPDNIVNKYDIVVVSPGIPGDLPFFDIADNYGVTVMSEVEFAYRLTPCPIAAITGTNGKTTTTALAGNMVKSYYKNASVVGNIGVPFSGEVEKLKKDDYVVAEISSFQMERAILFKPKISAVLNITPDHLNRHKTFENYIAMKEKVFANQDGSCFTILNYEDEHCKKMAEKTKAKVLFFSSKRLLDCGIYLNEGNIFIKWNNINRKVINVSELKILGVHNYENVMAAMGIALCAGVPIDNIVKEAKEFNGVEHRIEFVGTINGVDYFNDSKGTNPDAAIKAVEAMVKPIILIAGGYNKDSEYDEWVKLFKDNVKEVVLLGETAEAIEKCCLKHGFKNIKRASSFEEAVKICKLDAVEGDAVLLSPACASWDMFKSYEERGEVFKKLVRS